MWHVRTWWVAAGLMAWIAAGSGCGNKTVTDLLDKAKETVADGTEKVKGSVAEATANATQTVKNAGEQVKQQAGQAGSIDLQLNPRVNAKGGYVSFVAGNSGRPAVLQVRSYRDAVGETFPSVFIHAPVAANSLLELANETVAAQVFVQPEANGPVWFAREPVQIKLNGLQDKSLTGTFLSGTLENSHTSEKANAAGNFVAILP